MNKNRRTFLKDIAMASSAIGVLGKAHAETEVAVDFKRIAAEETFSIPEVLDAMRDLLERDPDREPGLSAPPYIVTDTIRALYDLGEGRIASMDRAGIDKQILSLWSPGVQVFGAQQGTELASFVNERLAEAVIRHPDRFAGLATVAPQDPSSAAQEIERAISSLHLNGVLINSHTKSEYLDSPKYWPIFEAAEALDAPIYLHPRTPSEKMYPAFTDYLMDRALWGFAAETSHHVVRLLMSGLFDEFPRLTVVLGHMGEGIPFWLDRLDQVSSRAGMPALKMRPSEYFKDNFMITTSAMFWDPVLMFCHSVLGPERLMFAVDSPFASSEQGTRWMDATPLSNSDKRKIYQENAERVFSL